MFYKRYLIGLYLEYFVENFLIVCFLSVLLFFVLVWNNYLYLFFYLLMFNSLK